MGPKVNTKVLAANAKKAAAQSDKEAAQQKLRDKEEAASWEEGANVRGSSKKASAEQKADEQLRKKQEMAELLAADEANVSGIVVKKTAPKKKADDPFAKLNAALAAVPKTKAQKAAEEKKAAAELKRKQEDEARAKRDEDKRKREAAAAKAGVVLDHGDSLMQVENTNKQDLETIDASNIADALSALSTSTTGADDDAHPEKRQKALHKAYVDKMMPVVKQDHPGLRMTQYQEKIFEMWKTAPENPRFVSSVRAREEHKKATINGVVDK